MRLRVPLVGLWDSGRDATLRISAPSPSPHSPKYSPHLPHARAVCMLCAYAQGAALRPTCILAPAAYRRTRRRTAQRPHRHQSHWRWRRQRGRASLPMVASPPADRRVAGRNAWSRDSDKERRRCFNASFLPQWSMHSSIHQCILPQSTKGFLERGANGRSCPMCVRLCKRFFSRARV